MLDAPIVGAPIRERTELRAKIRAKVAYLNIHSNCMAVGSFLPTAKYLPLPVRLQHRDG
jgi:hypothetical protein